MWYRTSSSNFQEPCQCRREAVLAQHEPHKPSLACWMDMGMRTASLAGAPGTSGSVVVLSLWQAPWHSMPSPLHLVSFWHGPFMRCLGQAGGVQGTGHQYPPPGTPSAVTPIQWGPCGSCFPWLFLPRVMHSRRSFGALPFCPGCNVWAKTEGWGPDVEEHHPNMWWETPNLSL